MVRVKINNVLTDSVGLLEEVDVHVKGNNFLTDSVVLLDEEEVRVKVNNVLTDSLWWRGSNQFRYQVWKEQNAQGILELELLTDRPPHHATQHKVELLFTLRPNGCVIRY